MRTTVGQWHHMVQCSGVTLEANGAIHAPLAAIAQRDLSHGFLRRHVRQNMRRHTWLQFRIETRDTSERRRPGGGSEPHDGAG